MSLVLDSSVTIAWIDPAETTNAVRSVFDRIALTSAWVPGLWRLEVANVLEMRARRGRNNALFRDETLADLAILPIQFDLETHDRAWGATARLAARHRLTIYDAAYLELALRRGLPLATLDGELRDAANTEQVELLGE
jgi:predicted nucleic acid-binding protein